MKIILNSEKEIKVVHNYVKLIITSMLVCVALVGCGISDEAKEKAANSENETLYICHGDCLEDAETLRDMILEEVKFKNVVINYVGNVIGAHAGPGVLAVLFLGENR